MFGIHDRHRPFADQVLQRGIGTGLAVGTGVNAYSRSASGAGEPGVVARKQGAYAFVSASATYAFSAAVQASLLVENLFDQHYFTRLGPINVYNYYGEPRNATVSLRVTF